MPPGSRKETPHAFTSTPNQLALEAVLPAMVTEILPELAPVGTVAVMLVLVLAVTVAATPLKVTMLLASMVLKLVPEMVTKAPTLPELGLKEEMDICACRAILHKNRVSMSSSFVFIFVGL